MGKKFVIEIEELDGLEFPLVKIKVDGQQVGGVQLMTLTLSSDYLHGYPLASAVVSTVDGESEFNKNIEVLRSIPWLHVLEKRCEYPEKKEDE